MTVANFNMGKNVSVLIHKKMNLMPRTFTLQVCDTINFKRHIQKVGPETRNCWWDPRSETWDPSHGWDIGPKTWDPKGWTRDPI